MEVPERQAGIRSIQSKFQESFKPKEYANAYKITIDTSPPIQSVRSAVHRFGGSIDWKQHKLIAQISPRAVPELEKLQEEIPKYKKQSQDAELAKEQVLEELESTKRLVEELKNSLEKTATEEAQAKHELEIATLRLRETEEGICNNAGAEAKAQVKVAKARHEAAIAELKSVQEELAALKGGSLKSRLEAASTMLLNLKAEFAAYNKGRTMQESEITEKESEGTKAQLLVPSEIAITKRELKEVNAKIEKTKDGINCLEVENSSLKAQLEQETEQTTTLRQRQGITFETLSSLEAELIHTQTELEFVLEKAKEAKEKMENLPKLVQQATDEANQAKSIVQLAFEELRKDKEEAEQAKACVSTITAKLNTVVKEIESAKSSKEMAHAAIKAMLESQEKSDDATVTGDESESVKLQLGEYYKLTVSIHEAETSSGERVATATEQIKQAKDSESASLQKLEKAQKELEAKKEALKVAVQQAETANEEKLSAERELKDRRAENDQKIRDNVVGASHLEMISSVRSVKTFDGRGEPNGAASEETSVSVSSTSCSEPCVDHMVPQLKPKKKKSLFPRFLMFLAKKKAQSLKPCQNYQWEELREMKKKKD